LAEEIRWQNRFHNFSRAYSLLRAAFDREVDELNDLEKEGVIQRFEYTFELSWNTLKDRLEHDGVIMQSVTPRNVIRTAAATGLVAEGQTWIDMLEDRRNTSHRYDIEMLDNALGNIRDNYLTILEELHQRLLTEMSG
jgi:nucleotidyltransferase substrate binding protein (TIGR01987 family)